MLRIYLDQNKWLDLARAAHGDARGRPFQAALDACRAAVGAGAASFPLDMYRYWETNKHRDNGRRNRLVDVMAELSGFDSIRLPFPILDAEIDAELARQFGRPLEPRETRVFGRGIRHLTDNRVTVPAGMVPIDRTAEEMLLRSGPDTIASVAEGQDPFTFGDMFVDHEVSLATEIAAQGWKRRELTAAVVAADFRDIVPAVRNTLDRAGITYDEFCQTLGDPGILAFVQRLPTRYVTNALRRDKHAQGQQRWEHNDFVDIVGLPVPAIYCDVLVTEKQWVSVLARAHVAELFGTILLSSTSDLVRVLETQLK